MNNFATFKQAVQKKWASKTSFVRRIYNLYWFWMGYWWNIWRLHSMSRYIATISVISLWDPEYRVCEQMRHRLHMSSKMAKILVGPAFLELLIETYMQNIVCTKSVTLYRSSLFEKWVSDSEAVKTLQFSNFISAIWCILFGNFPKRRKNRHLDDSPFPGNLNRLDIRSSFDRYDLIFEWNTDPIFSHLNLSSVTVFSPTCYVSSSSLRAFFSPPLFLCIL